MEVGRSQLKFWIAEVSPVIFSFFAAHWIDTHNRIWNWGYKYETYLEYENIISYERDYEWKSSNVLTWNLSDQLSNWRGHLSFTFPQVNIFRIINDQLCNCAITQGKVITNHDLFVSAIKLSKYLTSRILWRWPFKHKTDWYRHLKIEKKYFMLVEMRHLN